MSQKSSVNNHKKVAKIKILLKFSKIILKQKYLIEQFKNFKCTDEKSSSLAVKRPKG